MADVPTNIITVNFPDDGEGGGGGSSADMKAQFEALGKLQESVSRANVTLRLIYELLKGMGTKGRNAAVAAARGNAGNASTPRQSSASAAAAARSVTQPLLTPAQETIGALAVIRRSNALAFTPDQGSAFIMRQQTRALVRQARGRVNAAPPLIPPVLRASMGYVGASGAGNAARVAAAGAGGGGAARGGGAGGGAVVTGGGGGGGIGGALSAISAIMGPIGRVLAVGRMVLGAVQSIGQMIGAILAYSKDQRNSFGMVDPVIAKQNATVMIAGLMDRMALAQNPVIRASSGAAAQAELIRIGGTQNVRGGMTLAANAFSASWDRSIGYLGMGLEGDVRGIFVGVSENPLSSFLGSFGSVGLALQGISALLGLIFGAEWKADLDAKALARVRASTGIFVGDLQVMTGGRFSLGAAYPTQPGRMTSRGRVPGMVGNAGNWWNVPGTI